MSIRRPPYASKQLQTLLRLWLHRVIYEGRAHRAWCHTRLTHHTVLVTRPGSHLQDSLLCKALCTFDGCILKHCNVQVLQTNNGRAAYNHMLQMDKVSPSLPSAYHAGCVDGRQAALCCRLYQASECDVGQCVRLKSGAQLVHCAAMSYHGMAQLMCRALA